MAMGTPHRRARVGLVWDAAPDSFSRFAGSTPEGEPTVVAAKRANSNRSRRLPRPNPLCIEEVPLTVGPSRPCGGAPKGAGDAKSAANRPFWAMRLPTSLRGVSQHRLPQRSSTRESGYRVAKFAARYRSLLVRARSVSSSPPYRPLKGAGSWIRADQLRELYATACQDATSNHAMRAPAGLQCISLGSLPGPALRARVPWRGPRIRFVFRRFRSWLAPWSGSTARP
jgi:hypothetical protein